MAPSSEWLAVTTPVLSSGVDPVPAGDIADAERKLGFALPAQLRLAYREIGTLPYRGWTAIDRLLHPLESARHYLRHRSEPYSWDWPDHVVPIVDWGCGIQACVLTTSPEADIWWFDPNLAGQGLIDGDDPPPPWGTTCSFTEWIVRFARRDLFRDQWPALGEK